MKNNLKNKKVVYTIIGIIAVVLVAIAITYAYWLVTETQEGENVISTGCLDIDLVGENDITLPNQYPITDDEGKTLKPYTFTITNKCSNAVDYQIALESLDVEDKEVISAEALKVAINLSGATNIDGEKLSTRPIVNTTFADAKDARVIKYGTLAAKSDTSEDDQATYELRLWINADASIKEMNKSFKSKISVTVSNEIQSSWVQDGTIVENLMTGQTLEVGMLVDYDSGVGYYENLEGRGWRILGAEDGHLLLLSTHIIGTYKNASGEYNGDYSDGTNQYWTIIIEPVDNSGRTFIQQLDELDKACKPYVNDEFAISSRAITVDDINRVTGYNPDKTGTGLPYGYDPSDNEDKPTSYYGMEVTYRFNENNIVEYSYEYNNTKVVDTYNETTQYTNFWKVGESTNASELNTEEGFTVVSDSYLYYPTTLTANENGDIKGLSKDSLAYDSIFGQYYTLKSSYTRPGNGKVAYGIYGVYYDTATDVTVVKGHALWATHSGALSNAQASTRAVVTLDKSVKVSETGVLSK